MIYSNIKLSLFLPSMQFVFLEGLAPLLFLLDFQELGFPFHPIIEEVVDFLLIEWSVVVGDTGFLYHPLDLMHREIYINGFIYFHLVEYFAVVVLYFGVVLFHDISEVIDGQFLQDLFIVLVDVVDVPVNRLLDLLDLAEGVGNAFSSLLNALAQGVVHLLMFLVEIIDDPLEWFIQVNNVLIVVFFVLR